MVKRQFSECPDDRDFDFVIVGAGISGLYCAWRLIQQDRSRTIAIVERLDRTGGRLDSDLIEVRKGQVVREEEGGMRFNYGMEELMRLTCSLGLCDQIVPFPMSSADDTNRYQIRGHSFTVAQANAGGNMIWSELYDLAPEEVGLSPTDLVTNAYRNILYANGAKYEAGRSPEFWSRFRQEFTWKGQTLNEWQLWGLLRDMGYSEECVQMLSETIGFAGPFKSLANAGEALQILADFPKDPTYFTFERGFSTLPDAIVQWFEDNVPEQVQIFVSTNVDRIEDGEGYVLHLTEAPDEQSSTPFIPGGKRKSIRARQLVLAAAARGVETLFIKSPALHARPDARKLWENIHAALGMKLMKINLYFDLPWWVDGQTSRPAIQFGPNFSDLPVNAVYPFYSLPLHQALQAGQADVPDIREDAAAALTIYCDSENTNFWRGLQNIGPKFDSPLQTKQNDKRPQTLFAASVAVVEEARRQLAALFGTNWVPEPVLTSYRLWNGEDDFEFAYHQWRIGVDDSEVRDYLSAPREDLHVCNEAFSDMQGWVNGSIRSVDRVLAHFGLEPLDHAPCTQPDESAPNFEHTPHRRRAGLWGG